MKVAHLDTGSSWRGGQAQVLALMRGLAARSVTSVLLAPAGPLADRARAAGFTVHRWRPRGDLDLIALLEAARRLRAEAPEVAHCHTARAHAVGVPAARLAGVPAVLVARRVAADAGRSPWSRAKYRLPVDRYLAVSRFVADRLIAAGVPARRVSVVPDGIEPPRGGTDPSLRAALGIAHDAPVVGTVGALGEDKGPDVWLETAARVAAGHPRACLVWLGEGPSRARLATGIARLGLAGRVRLMGHRDDVHVLQSQFTVQLHVAVSEGLGTTLLDAQALGVPVVATAVGGVPEIVVDGVSGRLVAVGDASAAAAGVLEALTQPEEARRWSAGGREGVRAFHIDRTVERTMAAYREALAGGHPTGTEGATRTNAVSESSNSP